MLSVTIDGVRVRLPILNSHPNPGDYYTACVHFAGRWVYSQQPGREECYRWVDHAVRTVRAGGSYDDLFVGFEPFASDRERFRASGFGRVSRGVEP